MKSSIDFCELGTEKYWSFPASRRAEFRHEITELILSGKYLGSQKIDGHYFRFVKNDCGEMALNTRSRGVNGEFTNKLNHVPHLLPYFESLPNGTCLLGELYLPERETASEVTKVIGAAQDRAIQLQENISNCLHYYVFDIWQWNGESLLDTNAVDRFHLLNRITLEHPFKYIRYAKYFTGKSLLNELESILKNDGEGIVMTLAYSKPTPGKRPARKTIKVKKEIRQTLDVLILGTNPPTREYTGTALDTWPYWEDNKPISRNYALGLPGSLQIGAMRNGQPVEIGSLSGLPDDLLSRAESLIGHVAEISCMEIHATGGLRHPVFLGLRTDLNASDCEYSKIYS